ncbi:MAG: N-acetylmuramoyl-L-alanine amidase [Clostridia bacterium]
MEGSRKNKKILASQIFILSVLLLLTVLYAVSAANAAVGLVVNGKTIAADVAPYIDSNNRIMVPLRFFSEEVGFKVGYENATKIVQVEQGSTKVELKIGSPDTLLNGVKITMDTAAVISNARTMVPLRFIGEAFGAKVGFDNASKKANIEYVPEPVTPLMQIIVTSDIVNLRSGPATTFAIKGKVARNMILDVWQESNGWYAVKWDNNNVWIIDDYVKIYLATDVTIDNPIDPSVPPQPEFNMNNYYTGTVNTTTLNVRVGANTSYPVLEEVLRGESFEIVSIIGDWAQIKRVDNSYGWVAKQFLDINSRSKTAAELALPVIIIPSINLIRLESMVVQEIDGNITIDLLAKDRLNYTKLQMNNPSRAIIDFSYTDSSKIPALTQAVQNSLASTIRSGNPDLNTTRIVFDLLSKADIVVKMLDTEGMAVRLTLKVPSWQDKLIYLDAGHGTTASGYLDPGASGNGIIEKDYNMEIVNLIKVRLEAMGANVALTHTEVPAKILLDERAGMANDANADVFISIHGNAATTTTASGFRTYLYASTAAQRESRMQLANPVHYAVLTTTGFKDMGIQENSFVVIKQTKMPSLLLECGFLSNPNDAAMMKLDSTKIAIADGVVEGLRKYFFE